MSSQVVLAAGLAIIMIGLWIQSHVFVDIRGDSPATYKLFAARDRLIRLVVEGEIERSDPYFSAIYNNVNLMLAGSHVISGPDGWEIAELQGKYLAHHPRDCARLDQVPNEAIPDELEPVIKELTSGLEYLVNNHFGILVQISSQRREIRRLQKEQAKSFLAMIPHDQRVRHA